jgi:hypothetical protein
MKLAPRTMPVLLMAVLAAGLTACGSLGGSASTAAHGTLQPAGAASGSSSTGAPGGAQGSGSPGGAGNNTAGTVAGLAQVPAAARQVVCPASEAQAGGLAYDGSVAGQPVAGGQPIPAGFSPVAVVECVSLAPYGPGRGEGSGARKQAAISGLGGLMTAVREASAKHKAPGPIVGCITRPASPWFVLIGSNGQVIRPELPGGICSAAAGAVLSSLNSLHWITLGVTTVPPVVLPGQ